MVQGHKRWLYAFHDFVQVLRSAAGEGSSEASESVITP